MRAFCAACLLLVMPLAQQALAETPPTAAAMADRVDELLQDLWNAENIQPATSASDSQFLRRAHLDLIGVVPRVWEVRGYLADVSETKHRDLVDRLLNAPRHPTHLANTWRRILIPDGFSAEMGGGAVEMQSWLRGRFAQNLRYDRMVGDFLTATGGSETGPTLFYRALNSEPKKLAASTARIFLGLQLSCAQCHDHPFDDWSQEDFWEYAAFFAQVQGGQQGMRGYRLYDARSGEVTLPEEDEVIAPQFPDGQAPKNDEGTRRLQLSIWMSSANNPFLAKATVNRVWSLLFGHGIVNPVDDLSPQNKPIHPELLDELSEFFVASGYDLRELFRTLAYTDAYRLSSRSGSSEEGEARRAVFAQMGSKVLTAEQLFDSIQQSQLGRTAGQVASSNVVSNPARSAFVTQMESKTPDATVYAAGIQQTLHLMNGQQLAAGTLNAQVGINAALDAPFLDDHDRLDTLFLATVSRFPTAQERESFVAAITSDDETQAKALRGDLLWALLNSAEYRLNH